ncbi:MAG: hypothetical protein NC184_03675 [Roseburia sp.]|nr:hypothetical protein [Roseburia sp.]
MIAVGLLKKKLARLFAVAAICFSAALLTGCGASLTLYDYTENGKRYNVYELSIDADTVAKMEATAASDADGKKYTVPDYFYSLFAGFGYELKSASLDGEAFVASYMRVVSSEPDLFKVGTTPEFTTTYTENPFVRTYTSSAENPFNGVRAAYDGVLPDQSSTIIQQLKNGKIARDDNGDRIVLFPSVQDAFPYLKGLDVDGLLLNYARTGSSRMESSGRRKVYDGTGYYVFSRYFDTTDGTVEFKYKRPVAYGWYLVALAAGGATVAVIAVMTRTKKQKPTLLDRFPYNPEEYRDYDSHLPTAKR